MKKYRREKERGRVIEDDLRLEHSINPLFFSPLGNISYYLRVRSPKQLFYGIRFSHRVFYWIPQDIALVYVVFVFF